LTDEWALPLAVILLATVFIFVKCYGMFIVEKACISLPCGHKVGDMKWISSLGAVF